MKLLPLNKPLQFAEELKNIQKLVDNPDFNLSRYFTIQAQELLKNRYQSSSVYLTASCSQALEIACRVLDLKPGDEVIMGTLNFMALANAVALTGATPVFVDADPETMGIHPEVVRKAITSRTRAIALMYNLGMPCYTPEFLKLAKEYGLYLIEDAAYGIFSDIHGQPSGTLGDIGAVSFDYTKPIHASQGGALLVNNPLLVDKAEEVLEMGTNKLAFLRGEASVYTWQRIGSKHKMSELSAAVLAAQLAHYDEIKLRFDAIRAQYFALFHARNCFSRIPMEAAQWAGFYFMLDSSEQRQVFFDFMKSKGVYSTFHYQPLHLSKAGKQFGRYASSTNFALQISQQLARLPFYAELTIDEQKNVAQGVFDFMDTHHL